MLDMLILLADRLYDRFQERSILVVWGAILVLGVVVGFVTSVLVG